MLKVASSNIRFDNPADRPNDWDGRKELLSSLINNFSPDILGTQEGRGPQLKDLESLLPEHKLIDLNREWIEERMYPCIYVNAARIDVIDSGDIWLSKTPTEAGSKSFNSSFPRLCTWIQARVIETKKDFFYVNTHLDHILNETRQEQIKVLIQEVKKINSKNLPVILGGDFNESPNETVREFITKNWQELYDPWQALNKEEQTTYHSFGKGSTLGSRIDWILCDSSFKTKSIDIIKDHRGEIYPSDHFPVFAEFTY